MKCNEQDRMWKETVSVGFEVFTAVTMKSDLF
jgi:hypothetical protein